MFLEALRGSYVHLIPSALGFVVFTSLTVISLLRGKKGDLTFLFAGLCLLGGLINLDTVLVSLIPDKSTALATDRVVYFLFVFAVPVYIRFTHSFLEISGRKRIEYGALAASMLFSILTQTYWFIPELTEHAFGRVAVAGTAYHFFMLFAGAAVFYGSCVLARALRRTGDIRQKNRIKYILGGVGLGAVLLLLHYLPVSGFSRFCREASASYRHWRSRTAC